MAEIIRAKLEECLGQCPSIQAILITDKEGVIVYLVEFVVDIFEFDPAEREGIAGIGSPFSQYNHKQQASKLGLGRNKSIFCSFDKYLLAQYSHSPLILTFIGLDSDPLLMDQVEKAAQLLSPIVNFLRQHA